MGFRTQVSSRKSSSECLEHSGALIQLSVLFHHRKQLYPRIPSPRRLPTPTSDGIRTLSVRPSGSTHWFFRDLRVLYHYPLSLAALDDELSVHRPSRVSYQFRLQKESSNRLLPIGSSLRSTPVQSFLVQISIAASGASFRTDTVHGGRLSGSNQVVTFWGYDILCPHAYVHPIPHTANFVAWSQYFLWSSTRPPSVLSSTRSPSSSPVSESETGSEHSCSSSSSNTVDAENFPLPQSYVQLNPKLLNADLIKDLYESHAQDGLLGLCLTESRISEGTHWSAKRWNQYEYLLSTAPQGNFPIQAPRDDADILLIFSVALLRPIIAFAYQDGSSLYILERPPIAFSPTSLTSCYNPPSQPSNATLEPENAVGNIPSLEEWSRLWTIWDLVTLKMIPQEMLHQKPIDLRHKCLFYIGHIPTFLDMLLSRAIGGEATEPKYFWNIFERGIDPHVDDPDHCHNHSEVPERDEDWPSLETIITFRDGVRARLARLYDELNTGKRRLTRNIARTLVMTHEHEGFHVETLLYMLIQRGGTGTLPPLGFTIPPWTALAEQFNQIPPPSTPYATVGPAEIVLGHQDSEGDDDGELKFEVQDHEYGWDNESPPRSVSVGAFRAEWRPVTNAEFEVFWRDCQGKVPMPESWVEEDGELQVRTLYGPVPMHVAQHWPVLTSYDDLAAYAQSKGGRLPTEPELRLFLDTYDVGFEGGASLGFRHWHPVPATAGLDANEGRGSNGAVWEWTSTVFDGHEGLVPTKLFTGYSTDFFDTKHQVVLGASYATIPRLARRTVRNFYQHNYPYPWVSARVVYDL